MRGLRSRLKRWLAGKLAWGDWYEWGLDDWYGDEASEWIRSASFDALIGFHVLEHVDDRKALAELRLSCARVACLMFPVAAGWEKTYEDSTITDPMDREVYFGQADHVCIFGADAGNRIRSAGFALTEVTANGAETVRLSVNLGEKLFVTRRSG